MIWSLQKLRNDEFEFKISVKSWKSNGLHIDIYYIDADISELENMWFHKKVFDERECYTMKYVVIIRGSTNDTFNAIVLCYVAVIAKLKESFDSSIEHYTDTYGMTIKRQAWNMNHSMIFWLSSCVENRAP